MKNLVICGILAAGCCLSAGAQSKINGPGLHMLQDFKERAAVSRDASVPTVMAFATLEQGVTAADIAALGYEVVSDFGDILIVSLPLDKAEAFASLDEVYALDFGSQARPLLDAGRAQTGVDAIHAGTADGLNGTSYTGKGVVCGLYDTGLDPNHAAFRDTDGNSRVRAIYVARGYSDSNVDITSYTTPEQITAFSTENASETHGTHVLGIMGGTNGVKGKFARMNGAVAQPVADDVIPYYGVAPDADLMVGCGDFYDASILAGVAKVVDEAATLGKPVVVNLSLGNNSGSHDDKDPASVVLDRLGEKAIICIAAGNEGLVNMSITKNFNALTSKTLNTYLVPTSNPKAQLSYTAQFWSNNADAFETKLLVYNMLDNQEVTSVTIPAGGGSATLDSNNAGWAASFDGTCRVSGSVDRNTGRYCVTVTGSYNTTGSYRLAVNIVPGSDMVTNRGKINAYINTTNGYPTMTFSAENQTGYLNGDPNGSINGMGCGKNILSVGAYVSRTSWPMPSGTVSSYNYAGAVGEVAGFSSYGTTCDDRNLPHVVAPGSQIISSISRYYYENSATKMSESQLPAISTAYNRANPYYQLEGTSMATPFAAGVMALWLEAWPEMTIQDAQSIIKATSTVDNTLANSPVIRYGAGKINAIEGLKMAIRHDAALNTTLVDNADKNLIVEMPAAKQLRLTIPGVNGFTAALHNLSGAQVAAASTNGEALDIDGSSLAEGVYVLSAQTPAGPVSRKVVLR